MNYDLLIKKKQLEIIKSKAKYNIQLLKQIYHIHYNSLVVFNDEEVNKVKKNNIHNERLMQIKKEAITHLYFLNNIIESHYKHKVIILEHLFFNAIDEEGEYNCGSRYIKTSTPRRIISSYETKYQNKKTLELFKVLSNKFNQNILDFIMCYYDKKYNRDYVKHTKHNKTILDMKIFI